MNPADPIALAERVEAEQPSRELDLLVKAAVYGGEARLSPYNGEWCLYDGQDRSGRDKLRVRPHTVSHQTWSSDAYTSSLDAAMTLAGSDIAEILLDAIDACREACRDEPVSEFVKALPRFVTSASLRALAAQVTR